MFIVGVHEVSLKCASQGALCTDVRGLMCDEFDPIDDDHMLNL